MNLIPASTQDTAQVVSADTHAVERRIVEDPAYLDRALAYVHLNTDGTTSLMVDESQF